MSTQICRFRARHGALGKNPPPYGQSIAGNINGFQFFAAKEAVSGAGRGAGGLCAASHALTKAPRQPSLHLQEPGGVTASIEFFSGWITDSSSGQIILNTKIDKEIRAIVDWLREQQSATKSRHTLKERQEADESHRGRRRRRAEDGAHAVHDDRVHVVRGALACAARNRLRAVRNECRTA